MSDLQRPVRSAARGALGSAFDGFDALSWRGMVLVVALFSALANTPLQAQAAAVTPAAADLNARMSAFVDSLTSGRKKGLLEFFPSRGVFTYSHARYYPSEGRMSVWRFPAADVPSAITNGPLWPSFTIQFESQPIGLFLHQVYTRGREWRRVAGTTRFVPPDAADDAAIFVEWKSEDGRWVISSLGDESFPGGETPHWCC